MRYRYRKFVLDGITTCVVSGVDCEIFHGQAAAYEAFRLSHLYIGLLPVDSPDWIVVTLEGR